MPIALLAERHGEAMPLDAIGARLRCQGCGARPALAELVDDPRTDASGFVGGGPAQRRPLK